MRQFRELPYDLAERLELPEELLPGAGRLTVSAGRRAVIEGARGILEYSADCVTVSFGRQKLRLRGDALRAFGDTQQEHAPGPLRDVPVQKVALDAVRQVDHLAGEDLLG